MKITREFNKEFFMYFYTIYTIHSWSVLVVNKPFLKPIYCP